MHDHRLLMALPCALMLAGTTAFAQSSDSSSTGTSDSGSSSMSSGSMASEDDMNMTCQDFALLDVPGRGEMLVRLSGSGTDGSMGNSSSDSSSMNSSTSGSSSSDTASSGSSTDTTTSGSSSSDTASSGTSTSGSSTTASGSGTTDSSSSDMASSDSSSSSDQNMQQIVYVLGVMEHCQIDPSSTMGDASKAGQQAASDASKS